MALGSYIFESTIWLWTTDKAPASWHFITVPEDTSDAIKEMHGSSAKGFGSIKVNVTIGNSTWSTSLFPESKTGCYILPLKAAIRKAENIGVDDSVSVKLEVL